MSSTVISLYVLATLDAMFSGVCAASGRDARIDKRSYYLNAMIHGIVWGQAACVVGLLILAAAWSISEDPQLAMEQMVAVGEETGNLEIMLNKIADFYDDEVDTAVAALTSLLEPFLLVFMGGAIGSILIAMYLPIFTIADTIH